MFVCFRYRLSSGGVGLTNVSEDNHYDNREAAIFGKSQNSSETEIAGKEQSPSMIKAKEDKMAAVQRSGGGETLADLYGASTDESEDDGEIWGGGV